MFNYFKTKNDENTCNDESTNCVDCSFMHFAGFYMPPGCTVIVDEDMRLIDFSPEHEMKELLNMY